MQAALTNHCPLVRPTRSGNQTTQTDSLPIGKCDQRIRCRKIMTGPPASNCPYLHDLCQPLVFIRFGLNAISSKSPKFIRRLVPQDRPNRKFQGIWRERLFAQACISERWY
jgi:hypothetical protein